MDKYKETLMAIEVISRNNSCDNPYELKRILDKINAIAFKILKEYEEEK